MPDKDHKWILHVVDDWSKFQFAIPLWNKSASDVTQALQQYVFPVIGLPSIIQSDIGGEFINKLIDEVPAKWPGQVQLVSSRPHHSQSQGLVEQAHYTLERMIAARNVEAGLKSKSPPWTEWLPFIVCKFHNTCILAVYMYTIKTARNTETISGYIPVLPTLYKCDL